MGPKYGQQSGKLLKVEASDVFESPVPASPMTVDPLAHLRYTPITHPSAPAAPVVRRYHRIPVLKKRKSRGAHFTDDKVPRRKGRYSDNTVSFADEYARQGHLQQKKKAPEPPTLPLDMVCPKMMTPWYETPIVTAVHQPTEVLIRKRPLDQCYLNSINASMGREERSLVRFDQMKENQLKVENFLMSATGKTRGNLLIRKKQLLPKIARDGCERDLIKIERAITPKELTLMEFFSAGDSKYRFKSEIRPVVPKRERGYIVVTDWFGCPQVTDVIREKLGLASSSVEASHSMTDQLFRIDSEFVPVMATLGLVPGGRDPKITLSQCQEETSQRATLANNEHINLKDMSQTRSGTCPSHQNNSETLYPSLLVGDTTLSWSKDPVRPAKARVIELGCTTELGRNAISSLTMTNTGPTVIRISWVKKVHQDKLSLNKYTTTRFVFDSEARSILPSESFRISFAYRSLQLGYYSEDWQLVTRPALENGVYTIVRLWGITVASDSFKEERNGVDDIITQRETLTIVRQGLDELLQFLPTNEVVLREKRAVPALLGPDLFLHRNPQLNYMTAQIYRLGKLMEMAEAKKERRRKSVMGAVSSGGLSTYRSMSVSHEAVAVETVEKDPGSSIDDADDDDASEISEETPSSAQMRPAVSVRPSVNTFKTLIRRALNIDVMRRNQVPPRKRLLYAEEDAELPAEAPSEKSPSGNLSKFPAAPINVVNPDFSVDKLRDSIISMEDNMEEQEAYFYVMNENLEKLYFRPELAQPDLKLFYGRALLAEAVDKFNEYAVSLKLQCCLSQAQKKSFNSVREPERVSSSLLSETSTNDSTRSAPDDFNVSFNEVSKMSNVKSLKGDDMPEENLNVSYNDESKMSKANIGDDLPEENFNELYNDESKMSKANIGDDMPEENFNESYNDDSKMSKANIGDDFSRQTMVDSPTLEEGPGMQLPKKTSVLDGRMSFLSVSVNRPPVLDALKEETVSKILVTNKSATEHPATLTCPEMNAKLAFDARRYKCHYYNGLYGRMYQVLSEFLDSLDHVLASLQQPEPLKMNPEAVLTRKRDISRTDKNVEELLNAPLPPSWVKVAQRMEAVYAAIKERRGVTSHIRGSVS